MVKEIKTRPVEKTSYRNYMAKAEQFYQSMLDNYEKERWTACVVAAVHCTISGCDAISSFYLGFRYAGERHHDASELLSKTNIDKKEIQDKLRHFHALIDIKTLAEYEDRLMDEHDAERAKKACERFYLWVKEKVGVK